eukprot:4533935-Prymnesium_polylepis.1
MTRSNDRRDSANGGALRRARGRRPLQPLRLRRARARHAPARPGPRDLRRSDGRRRSARPRVRAPSRWAALGWREASGAALPAELRTTRGRRRGRRGGLLGCALDGRQLRHALGLRQRAAVGRAGDGRRRRWLVVGAGRRGRCVHSSGIHRATGLPDAAGTTRTHSIAAVVTAGAAAVASGRGAAAAAAAIAARAAIRAAAAKRAATVTGRVAAHAAIATANAAAAATATAANTATATRPDQQRGTRRGAAGRRLLGSGGAGGRRGGTLDAVDGGVPAAQGGNIRGRAWRDHAAAAGAALQPRAAKAVVPLRLPAPSPARAAARGDGGAQACGRAEADQRPRVLGAWPCGALPVDA